MRNDRAEPAPGSMNRGSLNLLIDLLAFVALLVMIGSGYVLRIVLPPKLHHSHDLWGLPGPDWTAAHAWAGIVLTTILFVHVVLHRAWIASMITRHQGRIPPWVVPAVLAAGAIAFAVAAHRSVRESDRPPAAMSETTFENNVRPILHRSCIRCHAGKEPAGGFDVERKEDFFSLRENGGTPLVVPGDAETSRLFLVISGRYPGTAAAAAHLLPSGEAAGIRAWIDEGAVWPEK